MTTTVRGPVVVGMDGSREAIRAAEYGAWEANRRKVPLRLVFAYQSTPMWGPAMLLANDYEWVRDSVRDILLAAEKRLTDFGVPVDSAVISGSPAAVLVEESQQASLVVIGTRATGGLMGHLSGSVAAQVAAHAHAPVVVLRPTGPQDLAAVTAASRPVVVGVDGSAESLHAVEFAVEEAVARGARLQAVYVWTLEQLSEVKPVNPEEYRFADVEATALRLLTEATQGWAGRYPELTISRQAVHGLDPVEVLVQASDAAGLIVVGARGHGGFLGLRLGSTVDGLVRHAGVPVAVVHAEPGTP